jgi:hypothetical protein
MTPMAKYFFHLTGEFPAHDVLGYECQNDEEAKARGRLIARHAGTEKPGMVREGNAIEVVDEAGRKVAEVSLVPS